MRRGVVDHAPPTPMASLIIDLIHVIVALIGAICGYIICWNYFRV